MANLLCVLGSMARTVFAPSIRGYAGSQHWACWGWALRPWQLRAGSAGAESAEIAIYGQGERKGRCRLSRKAFIGFLMSLEEKKIVVGG